MIDKILEQVIQEKVHDKKVAVLLSGGADSLSIALAANRLNYKVHAYSFQLGNQSTYDSEKSEDVSKRMNWDFTKVIVPTNNLKEDFHTLRIKWKCIKKTHYECTFPFMYVYPVIKEKYVLSGIAADGHYGVSKKAMNYRDPKERFDLFRDEYFQQQNPAGLIQQQLLSQHYGKEFVAPYLEKPVMDFFKQFDWYELNRPSQKHHVKKAFPEFKQIGKPKNHINLQLGAGIDKAFSSLLECDDINYKKRIRMMDVYRDWKNKGEIRTLFD